MAVLRIEIKVDGVIKHLFEMDTTQGKDPVLLFWDFMKTVRAQMRQWTFDYIFK